MKTSSLSPLLALGLGLSLLSGCDGTGSIPADYNELAAHPFVITQSTVQMDLAGIDARDRDARIRAFAVARPNDGSTFTVAADAAARTAVRQTLLAAGVPARDVAVVAATGTTITRVDRFAHADGCEAAPMPEFRPGLIDDGYGHSNANGALFGCAIRRNIAAMTADPRDLIAQEPTAGREGVRAAAIYDKWSKGQPTGASTGEAQAVSPDAMSK